MTQIKYLITLIVVLASVSLFSAAAARAEDYAQLREDYHRLSVSAPLQKQRTNWEKLISRLDHYLTTGKRAAERDKAAYLLARTWDGLSRASGSSDDAEQAYASYQRLVSEFPSSNVADDALFHAGRLAENQLRDKSRAHECYQRICASYGGGDMVSRAQARLQQLGSQAATGPQVEPAASEPRQSQAEKNVSEPTQSRASTGSIGAAPEVEKIRFWSGPEYTRIVFDLSAPVTANPVQLKGADPRLYFDLLYTRLAPAVPAQIPVRNGVVKQIRSSQHDEQKCRVVLDLNKDAEYRLTTLQQPYRLVVDIIGKATEAVLQAQGSQLGKEEDDSISAILNTNRDHKVPTLHVPQNQKAQGIHLIVVDAGHGGKDPGAIGPGGVREKDVTLALAKTLAASLRSQLDVKVQLTRSDDRFLELRERTTFANKVGADLFISLHANASTSDKAYGTETYFLNLSKNNQAAEVAARENGTSLQDVDNLEAILFDLMANAKINESSRLAAEIQQALVAGLKPHYGSIRDLGVKQGPFHVLLGATMPSVLVESAFISNSREEKRLTSDRFQKRVADAIVAGVKDYSSALNQVANR